MKIEKRLELKASPERVWSAITDPAELIQWWPDGAELDLRPGGAGWMECGGHSRANLLVEIVEPATRLVWKWINAAEPAVEGTVATQVEWTLTPLPMAARSSNWSRAASRR